MTNYELLKKRRSIRRFKQQPISFEKLQKIVDAGRLAPSAMNMQPLSFVIVDKPEIVKKVFHNTRWAGYLPADEGPPPAGQEPVAFIVVLINKELASKWSGHDVGAAMENMILVALEHDIGSCWIGSVNRQPVRSLLAIPDNYEIDSVLALGYPDENPVATDYTDSIKYYKDESGQLHVPKRPLNSILHHNTF